MMHSKNVVLKGLLITVLAFVVWGCSKGDESAPMLDASGKHPAGWVNAATGGNHPGVYIDHPDQCVECHGTLTDPKGGISGVSCASAGFGGITCHAGGPSHSPGFASPDVHGLRAKAVVTGANGFSFCQRCHGGDFSGGAAQVSCFVPSRNGRACHGVNAPHSPKPWLGTARNHITTDTSNASVCALCHTAGNNLSQVFKSKYNPAYTSGEKTCFNNTICHPNLGDCTGCHNYQQNTYRRIITGASGDFVRASHHVSSATIDQSACAVCHDQSRHRTLSDGVSVLLKNQDITGGQVVYDGTAANNGEAACVSCHDADGALILGDNANKPFTATGDNNPPPDIGWTAGAMAHSANMACFNCHGNSAGVAGNTLNPKFNAHGSATAKLLQNPAGPSPLSTNICYNCHGDATFAANGTTDIQSQFKKTYRHATPYCTDCHNPHTATSSTHVTGTNLASGAIMGANGLTPVYSGTGWTIPTSYITRTPQAATQFEYEICMKCHNGNTIGQGGADAQAWTDIGLEFNPNNASGHPITAPTGARALPVSAMKAPWTAVGNQTMFCSDCHSTDDATAPQGPHGSSVKWMLKGARKAWPHKVVAKNGTSSAVKVDYWTIGNVAADTGAQDGMFCLNCHNVLDDPHRSLAGHLDGETCVSCHLRVPHGGKISRLISTTTMSNTIYRRYYPDGNGGGPNAGAGTPLNLQSYTRTSGPYNASNCQTTCAGNHSAVAAETW